MELCGFAVVQLKNQYILHFAVLNGLYKIIKKVF